MIEGDKRECLVANDKIELERVNYRAQSWAKKGGFIPWRKVGEIQDAASLASD